MVEQFVLLLVEISGVSLPWGALCLLIYLWTSWAILLKAHIWDFAEEGFFLLRNQRQNYPLSWCSEGYFSFLFIFIFIFLRILILFMACTSWWLKIPPSCPLGSRHAPLLTSRTVSESAHTLLPCVSLRLLASLLSSVVGFFVVKVFFFPHVIIVCCHYVEPEVPLTTLSSGLQHSQGTHF